MPIAPNRTFVYGTFTPSDVFERLRRIAEERPGVDPDIAIEVLREFSLSEFIGRVHVKGSGGNWIRLTGSSLRKYGWYKTYLRKGELKFLMQDDTWNVKYFREESDETGPYVAAALERQESKRRLSSTA